MFVMKIIVLTLLKIANTSLEDKKRVNPYSNNNTSIECHQTNKRQRCDSEHKDNQAHHEASDNICDQRQTHTESTETNDGHKVVSEHLLSSTIENPNVTDLNNSFSTENVFVLKSNYNSNSNERNISSTNPLINHTNKRTDENTALLACVRNTENIREIHNIVDSNNIIKDTDTIAMSIIDILNEPNSNVMEVYTYEAYVYDTTDPFDLITSNFNIVETFIIENIVLTPEISNTERTEIELFENFISHVSANAKPCEYTPTTPDHCTCRCQWYEPADLKNIAHIMKNNYWLQGFEDFYYDLNHIDNKLITIDIQYRSHMQNFYNKLKEGHKQEIINLCNLLYQPKNKNNYDSEYLSKRFRAKNNKNFHSSDIYIKKLIIKKAINESQTSKVIISTLVNSKYIMDNVFKCLEKHKIQFDTKNLSSAYCSEIKSHYLAFITYTCFQYDALCKRFMFKNSLWGIHAYMAEFYFYIMWKLKRLAITPQHLNNFEEEYTKHLIKEMQSISDILEKYYILSNKFDDLELEDLCVLVYKFRLNIYKFLQLFYPNDIATALYRIATKSLHLKVYSNDFTLSSERITREILGLQKCLTQAEQIEQDKIYNEHVHNILHEKDLALKNCGSGKNMYLLFSFTLASFKVPFSNSSFADFCKNDPNISSTLFYQKLLRNSQLKFEIFSVVMKMETYLKEVRKGQAFEHSYDLMILFNQKSCAILHVNNTDNSLYELEILTFARAFYSLSEHILGLMR